MKIEQDQVVMWILLFIFLIGFFILFIGFPDNDRSVLFQYMFLITSLAIVFTGFFQSTGVFKTKGQKLGGAAAIFIIMLLSVAGGEKVFIADDYKELENKIKELAAEEKEKDISIEEALTHIKANLRELREELKKKENIIKELGDRQKIMRDTLNRTHSKLGTQQTCGKKQDMHLEITCIVNMVCGEHKLPVRWFSELEVFSRINVLEQILDKGRPNICATIRTNS